MSENSSPPSESGSPSAFEIATLAAKFLPPIDLPKNWESEQPQLLQDAVGKATGTTYPENPNPPTRPHYWPTPWEVMCEEAVRRAQMLLDAAGGKVREAVQNWRNSWREAEAQIKDYWTKQQALLPKFDKIAQKRQAITLEEALKFCLPRAKPEARSAYWLYYLGEDREEYQTRHRVEQPPVGDQSTRVVEKDEFPVLVLRFCAALETRGEAWRKKFASLKGKVGGKETQNVRRKDEAAADAGPVLVAVDGKKLAVAVERAEAHERGKG